MDTRIMTCAKCLALAATLAFTAATAYAASPGTPELINSFESNDDMRWVARNNVTVTQVAEGVTHGEKAMKVVFRPAPWPNVYFTKRQAWDWSGSVRLAFDVTNPGAETARFYVRVDDDFSADGVNHCRTGSGLIGAGESATYSMAIGASAIDLGMRGLPPPPEGIDMGGGSSSIDASHIVAFQVFMASPEKPATLIIDNVRLVPDSKPRGIVDEFGQYTGQDWPGKLKSTAELAARLKAESAALAAERVLPGRDRFGGWAEGPRLKATGRFRTEKLDGKWWFVDPDGYLFFSLGVDCVGTEASTIVTGREELFTWLPEWDDPLSAAFSYTDTVHTGPVASGTTFDFYKANLMRKYGAGYYERAINAGYARLKSWGFNTLGNWSDSAYYASRSVPFVATTGIGGDHARLSSGNDYWAPMHDPFDPQFVKDARAAIDDLAEKVNSSPWCLGVFVDNELSWGDDSSVESRYGLVLDALSKPAAACPAKRVFVRELKARYPDIADFNKAWGTSLDSWQAADASIRLDDRKTKACVEDLSSLFTMLAERYFSVVKAELAKAMPGTLYLGCRFAWRTPEAVAAAAAICDVVSFNVYSTGLDEAGWKFAESLGKPCIVGEFHFGALDRGMFHPGLVAAPDQAARAAMYEAFVKSVLDHPAFVGCHWFQYLDEPLTGRFFDGENYNIGFVDVTDTPYPEMVSAARGVHSVAYQRRWGR